MKYVDEYRDPAVAERLALAIRKTAQRPWTIMEVCGGQTHSIVRFGVDELLPPNLELIHGPGCPVCVTPLEVLDRALQLASRPEVTLCSFGDMLRVPGSHGTLSQARAEGGDVRVIYSPLEAVTLAESNPDREVVLLAVGFETTAPANAMALLEADRRGLKNFSVLVSHVRVPPALEALLSGEECKVDAFLAAGHVCTIMGIEEYHPIVLQHRVPIVVTGFEPTDILEGILMCVRQLESGRAIVENQYSRAVRSSGNRAARDVLTRVFEVHAQNWRGIGRIPKSGLRIRNEFRQFDAEHRFGLFETQTLEPTECISGLVLRGIKKPNQCPAFGTRCTLEHPLGAPMVSSEGACAAYYRYRRQA